MSKFMKDALLQVRQSSSQGSKGQWIPWAGVAILLFGGTAIALNPNINFPWNSELAASNPYRYPFLAQRSANSKPVLMLQQEIAFYQERVQIDPQSGLNLTSLAQAYLKMGKALGVGSWYLMAEQAAQRSLASLPFNNSGAILVLAKVREAQHQFQDALALADQVLEEKPDDSGSLAIVVTCHLAMGQYQRAETEAEKIVSQGRVISSLTLLALAKANLGKDAEAIQLFQEAMRLEEPGELGSAAWARTLLGRLYVQRGNFKQAEQLYQAALEIIPRYPLALIQSADLELRRGNSEKAQRLYKQVISDSRNGATIYDHLVLRGLARTYHVQENPVAMQDLYYRAEQRLRSEGVGHAGGSFGHRRELAQLLLERGQSQDLAEALNLMREEVKIRRDTDSLDTLAWALVRSQQPQEARQVLQEVIDRGTRDAVVFYRAGAIAKQQGDSTKAVQWFQRSHETDPMLDAQARSFVGL